MNMASDSASFATIECRAIDDWAYIVVDNTTFPCSARRIGLHGATLENVVVAVGERLKLFVHLPMPDGRVTFLGLSGSVTRTHGHRAHMELSGLDPSTARDLSAWIGARVAR